MKNGLLGLLEILGHLAWISAVFALAYPMPTEPSSDFVVGWETCQEAPFVPLKFQKVLP